MTEDEQKKLMAAEFRRQEEMKVSPWSAGVTGQEGSLSPTPVRAARPATCVRLASLPCVCVCVCGQARPWCCFKVHGCPSSPVLRCRGAAGAVSRSAAVLLG